MAHFPVPLVLRIASLSGLFVLSLGLAACAPKADPTRVVYQLAEEARWAPAAEDMTALPANESEPLGLSLAADRAVSFYLRLQPGSLLSVASLAAAPGTTVHVSLRLAGEEESTSLAELGPSTSPQTVELLSANTPGPERQPESQGPGQIAQLILEAVTGNSEAASAVELRGAEIRITASGAEPFDTVAQAEYSVTADATDETGDAEEQRPNVFFFVVDTLRADHLGLYGYDRGVSPSLDAFAQDAFVFDDAAAQSAWTRPTVASMFTGLEPHLHKLNYFDGHLPKSNLTIAELLKDSGYTCEGIIANAIIRNQFGFGQGFRNLVYRVGMNDAGNVIDYAIERVTKLSDRQPLLFYVHTMDPHLPYDPPADTVAKFAPDISLGPQVEVEVVKDLHREGVMKDDSRVGDLINIYDAEIANVDRNLGRYLGYLRESELYEDSLIIFTVDHGEAFWDRGMWGHGHDLHRELVRIPLLVKPPGGRSGGQRLDDLVSQVDLFRTVADYVGLEVPDFVGGRSLRPLMEGQAVAADPDHSVFAHANNQGFIGVSLTTEDWKLIEPRSEKMGFGPTLVDRVADPGEWKNVFDQQPVVVGYLQTLLREHEAQNLDWIEPESDEVTPEEKAELEALGYI